MAIRFPAVSDAWDLPAPVIARLKAIGLKGDKGDKGNDGDPGPAGTANIATYPAGYMHARSKLNGAWQDRGTTRKDITVTWIGPLPAPPVVTSGTGGMYEGDMLFVTDS